MKDFAWKTWRCLCTACLLAALGQALPMSSGYLALLAQNRGWHSPVGRHRGAFRKRDMNLKGRRRIRGCQSLVCLGEFVDGKCLMWRQEQGGVSVWCSKDYLKAAHGRCRKKFLFLGTGGTTAMWGCHSSVCLKPQSWGNSHLCTLLCQHKPKVSHRKSLSEKRRTSARRPLRGSTVLIEACWSVPEDFQQLGLHRFPGECLPWLCLPHLYRTFPRLNVLQFKPTTLSYMTCCSHTPRQ